MSDKLHAAVVPEAFTDVRVPITLSFDRTPKTVERVQVALGDYESDEQGNPKEHARGDLFAFVGRIEGGKYKVLSISNVHEEGGAYKKPEAFTAEPSRDRLHFRLRFEGDPATYYLPLRDPDRRAGSDVTIDGMVSGFGGDLPQAAESSEFLVGTPTRKPGAARVADRNHTTGWLTTTTFAGGGKYKGFAASFERGWLDSVAWMAYRINGSTVTRGGAEVLVPSSVDGGFTRMPGVADLDLKKEIGEIHERQCLAICEWSRTIAGGSEKPMNYLFGDPAAKGVLDELRRNIVAEVVDGGWDGAGFNIENIGSRRKKENDPVKDGFTAFARDLAKDLHAKGRLLRVSVPGKFNDDFDAQGFSPNNLGMQLAFDWKGLKEAGVDFLVAECYDGSGDFHIDPTDKYPSDRPSREAAFVPTVEKILGYAGKTFGRDGFMISSAAIRDDGVAVDEQDVLERVAYAKKNGVGFALWTAHSRFWRSIVKAFGTRPAATFEHQPLGTPRWYLDELNGRWPPRPPSLA
ncbi:MAG TPA: hypothetical protein VHF22_00420 [Planctomycetota bacterium]|nr:hypothetical protein [Planctomycetota bacterium]